MTIESGEGPNTPTNPAATVAILAGLLACIPGTGLVSIPAGIVGLRKAKHVGGLGRGTATFGLVLGLINVMWWSAIGLGAMQTFSAYKKGEPAIKATGQFIVLVGGGNVAQAKTLCVDGVTEEQLTNLFEQIAANGTMQQPNPYYGGAVHSESDVEVRAELKFENVTRILQTHWTIENGPPKLFKFEMEPPPTTQASAQKK